MEGGKWKAMEKIKELREMLGGDQKRGAGKTTSNTEKTKPCHHHAHAHSPVGSPICNEF